MPFVSATRLRIRSIQFVPVFAAHVLRAYRQIKTAPGFRGGSVLADRGLTFWTLTSWDDSNDMRSYMARGAHREAMPHLASWCDEASVAHWEQADDALPSWLDVDRRMRETGRASHVRRPSPTHADLTYPPPSTAWGGRIRPTRTARLGSASK